MRGCEECDRHRYRTIRGRRVDMFLLRWVTASLPVIAAYVAWFWWRAPIAQRTLRGFLLQHGWFVVFLALLPWVLQRDAHHEHSPLAPYADLRSAGRVGLRFLVMVAAQIACQSLIHAFLGPT